VSSGPARVHGRFNSFAGAVRVAEDMERSAMHVVIDAASADLAAGAGPPVSDNGRRE
jgi:polyisoprenoid-binding protein YceI